MLGLNLAHILCFLCFLCASHSSRFEEVNQSSPPGSFLLLWSLQPLLCHRLIVSSASSFPTPSNSTSSFAEPINLLFSLPLDASAAVHTHPYCRSFLRDNNTLSQTICPFSFLYVLKKTSLTSLSRNTTQPPAAILQEGNAQVHTFEAACQANELKSLWKSATNCDACTCL